MAKKLSHPAWHALLRFYGWVICAILVCLIIDYSFFPSIILPPLVILLGGVAYLLNKNRRRNAHEWHNVRWRVLGGLALVGLSFVLFFWRRGITLDMTGVSQTHPVIMQAVSYTICTALLLVTYYVLRFHPIVGFKQRSSHPHLLVVGLLMPLFLALIVAYSPALTPTYFSGSLTAADLGLSLLLLIVYALILEAHHRTPHHTSHGLITHHGHAKVKKHLPTKPALRRTQS